MSDNIYYLAKKKKNAARYKRPVNKRKIFFLIIIILSFVLLIYHIVTYSSVELITAKYGEVVDGFQTEALIVRNERLFSSPYKGRIKLLKNEGERVAYGEIIMEVGGQSLYSRQAGLISFAEDGLEKRLHPDNFSSLSVEDYNSFTRDFQHLTDGSDIREGDNAYRIIDNKTNHYVIIKTSREELERYRMNEKVFIKKNTDRALIEGVIKYKNLDGDTGLLVIYTRTFVDEWLNLRRVELEFIKNIYRGIKIPRSAVFSIPEGEGVLITYPDGNIEFIQIKITDGNNTDVIVEGLETGVSVIINPEVVNYGRGVSRL